MTLLLRPALFLMLLLGSLCSTGQQVWKITDTVYYNVNWQICEEPVAAYYRTGVLAGSMDRWFHIGPVKDYTRDHKLLLEGEYNDQGKKHGRFRFYNYSGSLKLDANYDRDSVSGIWKWFYNDGSERASVYFPEGERSFRFISYRLQSGTVLMSNGVGTFEWQTSPVEETDYYYNVRGQFNKGLREGMWEFSPGPALGNRFVPFAERYDPDGTFQSGFQFRKAPLPFRFQPLRLLAMESMIYDPFFRLEGDSAKLAVLNYLIDKRTAGIPIHRNSFDSSFNLMLNMLEAIGPAFDYSKRDIHGQIEFRIGPAGFPEELEIKAENTDSSELKLLHFIMNKFRRIEMPSSGNIAYEAFHKIYFYVIPIKEYFPAGLRNQVDKDIVFSAHPKEETLKRLEADKKNIKRYIRRNYAGYR